MALVPYNSKVLHEECETFNFDNPQTDPKKLANDLMFEKNLMNAYGLAANQIGVSLRVFAFIDEVAFNPEILEATNSKKLMEEGCLSYPDLWISIERPSIITARYYTEDGVKVERILSELETRVFLHELDHLNGKTIIDHASKFKLLRSIAKAKKYGYDYTYKKLRNSI